MKRRGARNVLLKSEEVKVQDELTLNFENVEWLTSYFAAEVKINKNKIILSKVKKLDKRLKSFKFVDVEENFKFVISFEENARNIIYFEKIKDQEKINCLLIEFQSNKIVRDIISNNFNENLNIKTRKYEECRSDVIFIKIIQTLMTHIRSEETKRNLIDNFGNEKNDLFQFTQEELKSYENEIRTILGENFETFASKLDTLSKDSEFKLELNKYICSIPTKENEKYLNLLQQFTDLTDNDENKEDETKQLIEKLEAAKNDLFNKANKIVEKTSKNEKNEYQLEIYKNFPIQMKKFDEILTHLRSSIVDENLDEVLNEICFKLDLEFTSLKKFFNDEIIYNDNNELIEDPVEILKALPKPIQQEEDPDIKSFDDLIKEIAMENKQTMKSNFINSLRDGYSKVKCFKEKWWNKSAEDILNWAKSIKGILHENDIYESIAIMDRANFFATGGQQLRDTQILTIISFLSQTYKGHLSQIHTGEGKTTIVAILAAIQALKGHKVDIVTSNPILAIDGIKSKKLFYVLLDLKVDHNNLDEKYDSGERKCYKADIVYGSISNFQFDFLKDSFLGLDTRGKRPFDIIILDEVDSMIIDNASHIAKLSSPFPGMDSLKYVYIKIWILLRKVEENIQNQFKIESLKKADELRSRNLSEEETDVLFNIFKLEFEESTFKRIFEFIKSQNPTEIEFIPSHIKDFAEKSLDKWINSAIEAKYSYNEDENYVIRNNEYGELAIQPVDYANTGVTLKNTIWQNGLHQFLQLKHNLYLSSESLTSCFISNLGYINKYENKLYGLTGTLGSTSEQQLISSVYNVGFSRIPTYKIKKFKELPGRVIDDENFVTVVSKEAVSIVENKGSVLIICETIKDAKMIKSSIEQINIKAKIRIFCHEEDSHVTQQKIEIGEIIIATNIAGRGTDLNVSTFLNSFGGLRVLVCFLPCNKRVEDQAFGRTARQGSNGSAQLFIKKSEIEKLAIDSKNIDDIKKLRDELEAIRIENIKEFKIKELMFQDKLFKLFAEMYRKLKSQHQGKDRDSFKFVLNDLKEFWAFWLEEKDFSGPNLNDKTAEKEFEDFEKKISNSVNGKIIFNPYYSIQQAEYFISVEKLDEAQSSLENAIRISKNPQILYGAYMKLFEVAIEKGKVYMHKFQEILGKLVFMDSIRPDREYKTKARKYLNLAKDALQKELDFVLQLTDSEEFAHSLISDENENIFLKHLASKQQALNLNICNAESLVLQLTEFQAGVALNGRISNFASLTPKNENERKLAESMCPSEISELATIGASTTYVLKEVHDLDVRLTRCALGQISGGLVMLGVSIVNPLLMPIASTMITEGICDIATEILFGTGKFEWASYLKGKAISYGIAVVTVGINFAKQCPKILNKAKEACRWFAGALRKSPYLQTLCEKLATLFDKLGGWFEKMETLAEFNNAIDKAKYLESLNHLSEAEKLAKLKHLGDRVKNITDVVTKLGLKSFAKQYFVALQKVALSTTKQLVMNKVTESLVVPFISMLLDDLKPMLEKHVKQAILNKIDKDKLKSNNMNDINASIKEIRDSIDMKIVYQIFYESIMGIAKHCNNWKLQLCALSVDQFFSWKDVYTYATDLCKNLNQKLKISDQKNQSDGEVDKIVNDLSKQITDEMHNAIANNIVKSCRDICTVGFSAHQNYHEDLLKKAECLKFNREFKEGGQAGLEQANALSDVYQRPIHIIDEYGNIVKIRDDGRFPGEPVVLKYYAADDNNPGHYVPEGMDRSWGKEGNSCMFDAFGHQTGHNSDDLRQNTLKQIESDPKRYIAPHIRGNINEADVTKLIMQGGCPVPYHDEDSDELGKGIKGNKQGHADIHLENNIPNITDQKTVYLGDGTRDSEQVRNSVYRETLEQPTVQNVLLELQTGERAVVKMPSDYYVKNKNVNCGTVKDGNIISQGKASGHCFVLDDKSLLKNSLKTGYAIDSNCKYGVVDVQYDPTLRKTPPKNRVVKDSNGKIKWFINYKAKY